MFIGIIVFSVFKCWKSTTCSLNRNDRVGQIELKSTPDVEILVVNDFESKAQKVQPSDRSQKASRKSINQDRWASDYDQMLKAKDKIDNQLLPLFEEENHYVLISQDVVLTVINSVYLDQSLVFPPWMQKDVVVDVNVADAIEEGLVKGLQAI